MRNLKKALGMDYGNVIMDDSSDDIIRYINLKLASLGQPFFSEKKDPKRGQNCVKAGKDESTVSDINFIELTESILQDYQEKTRLLSDYYCPADRAIIDFLKTYFEGTGFENDLQLPSKTFVLDQYGLARKLSLPPDRDDYTNNYIKSYRITQGILHNPKHDRRTTKGSFHIVEGSLPVPLDKKEVPKRAFANLLKAAVNPPEELLKLPFTSNQEKQAKLFVSLLLRPLVSPGVEGVLPEKRMEIRFFAPGSLVSSLDFVESIFGNAGDPTLCTNDAGLDVENWTGHTGCVILAPHLINIKKKDLGLPHYDYATDRQKRDGMCWKEENEIYNDGTAFKLSVRDDSGVVVTLIADNYFGYSKKEVKTQISYSANLMGLAEEEHAGGTVAFPRKSLAEHFYGEKYMQKYPHTFEDVKEHYRDMMDVMPENYGIDKKFKNIIYVPEDTEINLYKGVVSWTYKGEAVSIKLLPKYFYIHPTGYKINMQKHPASPAWKLIGTAPEGTFLHKPCTVSGGGKSEISKSLMNAIVYGSFYVHNINEDLSMAEKVIDFSYKNRWKNEENRTRPSRPLLSPKRTLGSVIKLLTPSDLYEESYNRIIKGIPNHVKALVLFIKRFYRPEWGNDWKKHFSVDIINGKLGNSLFYNNRKIMASYLRLGFASDNSWYLHKLRTDFMAAAKIQMEDDITASVTIPADRVENLNPEYEKYKSIKFSENCEFRFFQRPDEAINRGYDKQAELDLSLRNNFTTNYQPLTPEDARNLIEEAIEFDQYTPPIKDIIREGAKGEDGSYFISSSHPRIVDGAISKNPRYLQVRPDFSHTIDYYLAELGMRMFRKIPLNKPLHMPVNAVLPGRRNNPPDKEKGIRSLSVYNPIHYQELPELFMDFVCSLTGKSPSTTGAGSEGALTKGPFNMLIPTTDLNNALISYIMTSYNGFTTAAGHVGTDNRFDHDISILIPELWCRMSEEERDPKVMIGEGSLEKLEDFEHKGKKIFASRLGYRITEYFLFRNLGKIFDEPQAVFNERMLKPEIQDMDSYADGINNIVEAQKKVALLYFEDGSIESAIPPLKAILHVMAYGNYDGKEISDPEIREMFKREIVIESDWYLERLKLKQEKDIAHWERRVAYLENFLSLEINRVVAAKMNLDKKLQKAKKYLKEAKSAKYMKTLIGTIGADPLFKKES